MAAKRIRQRAAGWCFTINNYTDNDIVTLQALYPDTVKYIVFGREVGENNTPHLQGYLHCINKKEFNSIKKLMPTAHIEKIKGTPLEASTYCKKDGNFTELGELPNAKGGPQKRTDLLELANNWRTNKSHTLLKDEPTWYIMMARIKEQVMQEEAEALFAKVKQRYETVQLYKWQQQMTNKLQKPVDPRAVYWLYDYEGNTGKSWYSRFLVAHHNAIRLENGKNTDIKFAYNGQSIVVFDFSRTIMGRVNYEAIESIKNGIFFNSKYQSGMKIFDSPHVICLANFEPDLTKLSSDRWHVKMIHNVAEEVCGSKWTTELTPLIYR